jgi:hypothetical protein
MKLIKLLVVALSVVLSQAVMAETVIQCTTNEGKDFKVDFDRAKETLTINYGPEYSATVLTNNMGTSYMYSASEGVADREFYYMVSQYYNTIAVTDRGSDVLVSFKQEVGDKTVTLDSCKENTVVHLPDYVAENMTAVDDE